MTPIPNYYTLVVYHLIRKPGWSTGVVNGKRQNTNGNFHTEFAVPFTVPSDPIQKAWNWSERANGTHNFRSEIPFGNFGPPSRNPVFPGNFPFGKTKLVFPFTFQPKFLDFFVNGKQPLSYRKHWNYNFYSDSA